MFGGWVYNENGVMAFDALSFDWVPGGTNASVTIDLNSQSHSGGNGVVSVHRGFLRSYLNLRDQLFALIGDRLAIASSPGGGGAPPLQRVVIAGHSMGAALASLAALDIASSPVLAPIVSSLRKPLSALLFASPQVCESGGGG
jgi:alpha-beta hydrolase superfamily lysophospholipase